MYIVPTELQYELHTNIVHTPSGILLVTVYFYAYVTNVGVAATVVLILVAVVVAAVVLSLLLLLTRKRI